MNCFERQKWVSPVVDPLGDLWLLSCDNSTPRNNSSSLKPSNKNSTIDDNTKNVMYCENRKVYFNAYNSGNKTCSGVCIMPEITNFKLIQNKDKLIGVIVFFGDNTKEKVVVTGQDVFSLETGIGMCVAKKLLSMKSNDMGSSLYNKIVKKALKDYEKREADKAKKEEERRAKALESKAKKMKCREVAFEEDRNENS